MDNQFQDLQWVVDRALKLFQENDRRSVSAAFRKLRKNPHFSLFGDYFIFWAIKTALEQLHITKNRHEIWYALKYSDEYTHANGTEKRWWLNNLTPTSPVVIKTGILPHRKAKKA